MLDQPIHYGAATATSSHVLTMRRIWFFTVVGLTIAGLVWLACIALSPGGFSVVDFILVVMFAVTLPWVVIGFWNAMIGFLLMRFSPDPVAAVTPAAGRIHDNEPITASTAILLCIRNEPPDRTLAFIKPLLEGLVTLGVGSRFHVYVLSDTSDPAITAAEDKEIATFAAAWRDKIPITYRRRTNNAGFKAGNIRDFCDRWGRDHEFAVVLDADSVMMAPAVLRLVRLMQVDPQIGITQSLVIGRPSTSAFARVFQFGMRLAMRSYTLGSAWWQGDCGPYWGHNAILRLAPFMAHCELPPLPDNALIGGHVLSHDQIEAVLMRRAGWEVRVLAEEGESFEQNPPTLLEFIRRDLRWCQGNMQYWHFLQLPNIKPVSRYQLGFAILMFIGSPAWIGLLLLGTAALLSAESPQDFIRADAAVPALIIVLVMWFSPKWATVLDVLTRPELRRQFGGTPLFLLGALAETIFAQLLAPIMWFGHTMFLVRLLIGRTIGWTAQVRSDHMVPVLIAFRQLWPQTLLGVGSIGVLAATVPEAIPYALFIAAGPLLSVPLAIVTSLPGVGRAMVRLGICGLPEEISNPAGLAGLPQ